MNYISFSPYGNIIAKSANLDELIKITNERALALGGDCYICEEGNDLDPVYETSVGFCLC